MATVETDWWRRWPGTYQREQSDFSQFGAKIAEKKAKDGQLVLAVEWPLEAGEFVDLTVEYSPHHPHFRPRISSGSLQTTLSRHVDPFTGGLCLITQDSDQWDPNQTAAALIHQQLPKIFDANECRNSGNASDASDIEEHAPDPLSAYYDHTCEAVSAIHFDGDAKDIAEQFGFSTFSFRERPIRETPGQFVAYLDRVESSTGRRLATLREKWRPADQWKKMVGPWVRLDMPRQATADELFALAQQELRARASLQPAQIRRLEQIWQQPFSITSILFQDELRYDGDRLGDNWFFIASRKDDRGRMKRTLVRGLRLTDDILARAPIVQPFSGKRVVVLGTGAIGSFVAIELARAGVAEIHLVDSDILEPGNSVRWPLGQVCWGLPKPMALRAHIQQNFPRTKVSGESRKIGSSYPDVAGKGRNEFRNDLEIVRKSDLVIDTTASVEVASAISRLCKDAGVDYLMAYATMGAVGGLILEQPATGPACYFCLREHWAAETLSQPPVDESGTLVPVGCNAPTFTGASFDLQEISLSAVRSSGQMLKERGTSQRTTRLAILAFANLQNRQLPLWSLDEVTAQCNHCSQNN